MRKVIPAGAVTDLFHRHGRQIAEPRAQGGKKGGPCRSKKLFFHAVGIDRLSLHQGQRSRSRHGKKAMFAFHKSASHIHSRNMNLINPHTRDSPYSTHDIDDRVESTYFVEMDLLH